jgi:putative SOS response-associated peptidase YedK
LCGRYAFYFTLSEISETFKPKIVEDEISPNYNVSPMQKVPIIHQKDEELNFEMFQWGLIPHWAKDWRIGYKMINARRETIFEKRSYKNLIINNRCLILANGFFEWIKTETRKIPYFIYLKDRKIFGFAGIWSQWIAPTGEEIKTCSIITTSANKFMKTIHNRMPVIIHKQHEDQWIKEDNMSEVKKILSQNTPEEMMSYEVSPLVNRPRNNDIECINPIV